jgi:hypothetical protein
MEKEEDKRERGRDIEEKRQQGEKEGGCGRRSWGKEQEGRELWVLYPGRLLGSGTR